MTAYRPEVDGLRAVAVLPVIAFHAGLAGLPGGFLGVDVFFVISGYLITSILLEDLRQGRFSIGRFYERRARRILPALFLVVAATLPFAAAWMLPSRLSDYGLSVAATLAFASNVFFWLRTGYFMPDAETEPLLHTWSLAIEEQFYLLFPLLLWALWRAPPRLRTAALALLALASLATAQVLAGRDPASNFYLLPSRAWELLAGALLAATALRAPPRPVASALSVLGLAMVAGAMVALGRGQPMPSAWTLIPVGGAVLVLAFATPGTPGGWLLSRRPVVLVGLLSYSLYLWHWPILVLARLRWGEALPPPVLAGALAATFALSWLTWRFIETPFRERGPGAAVPLRALVPGLVAAAVALVAVSQLAAPRVAEPEALAAGDLTPAGIEAKVRTNYGLDRLCEGSFTLAPECRTSDRPEVLLWGDSFAMHLAPALHLGTAWGGMVQMTKSVCLPAVGISVVTEDYPAEWAEGCIAFNDQVLDWLATQDSIRLVVASSPLGLIWGDVYQRGGEVAPAERPDLVRAAMVETARRVEAMGKRFVWVSPPPVTGEDLGACLAREALAGGAEDACDFPREVGAHALSHKVYDFLRDVSADLPVVFLDTMICPDGICRTRVGTTFLYRDRGHLSIEGSEYLERTYGLTDRIRRAAGL